MTGTADPMMSFPAGTVFTPFSVVRNVGDQTVLVTPSLYWMQGGAAHSARLQAFTLAQSQTRGLDVPSLIAAAGLSGFNGSVNLILESQGQSRSLLLASGSVDQKNTYVFQVLPRGVQDSGAKTISYWSTANGDDTMVTVWNPADEAQDFLFTLYFTGGNYRLPIHLEPRATQMLNISEITQNRIPDDKGNTIPPTVKEGSATLSGAQADNQEILVTMDAGTYNVRKATCTYYCISCNGTTYVYTVLDPFYLAKGGQTTLNLMAQQNTGGTYSLYGSSWSSNNNSVATVGSTTGVVTGVAPGSVTISAYLSSTPWYNSNYWYYDPFCPYYNSASGSGGGNIGPYRVEPIATPLQGAAICPAKYAGWSRNVTAQLQYSDGTGYRVAGITVADILQVTGTNQLGINQTETKSWATDGNGSWPDTYYVCSTACPSTKVSDAIQSWTYNSLPLPHSNLVVYKCSSIKIDGY
jgi:hypothetical protein